MGGPPACSDPRWALALLLEMGLSAAGFGFGCAAPTVLPAAESLSRVSTADGSKTPPLDLLFPGGEHSPATLLSYGGESILIDGGGLGASMARLLASCSFTQNCPPAHLIATGPQAGRLSGLLMFLAGPDHQPGNSDDLRLRGTVLELFPERSCDHLECLAFRENKPVAARPGDQLALSQGISLRWDPGHTKDILGHPGYLSLVQALQPPLPFSFHVLLSDPEGRCRWPPLSRPTPSNHNKISEHARQRSGLRVTEIIDATRCTVIVQQPIQPAPAPPSSIQNPGPVGPATRLWVVRNANSICPTLRTMEEGLFPNTSSEPGSRCLQGVHEGPAALPSSSPEGSLLLRLEGNNILRYRLSAAGGLQALQLP